MSLEGRRAVLVENYRKILFYSEGQVKIQSKTGIISICGKKLKIEYYDDEEMKISGCISSVQLEGN